MTAMARLVVEILPADAHPAPQAIAGGVVPGQAGCMHLCSRAWPMINRRAVADTRNTGLGPKGRCAAQTVQLRAAALKSSRDIGELDQYAFRSNRQIRSKRMKLIAKI